MKSLILLMLLIPLQVFAYIPDYKMIMSRVAENHGRGFYKITQDVIFPADPEPLVVEETWVVSGDEDMSVTLRGKGLLKDKISGTIIYKNGKKYYRRSSVKNARIPDDFLESLFHFRYSKRMKPKLVTMKIAPSESLKSREAFEGDDVKNFPEQSFVRLARTGGFVAYAVGEPTPVDQAEENPGLWIEQDRFHVRKVRTDSGATVLAANYSIYPRKFWLPKTRQYNWDNHSVQALVSTVNPLPRNSKSAAMVNPATLSKKESSSELQVPEKEIIRSFYQRFR